MDAFSRCESRAGLPPGVLGLGLPRLRPAAEASQSLTKLVLGLGALELAKDIGLFLFYIASNRSRAADFSSRLTSEA